MTVQATSASQVSLWAPRIVVETKPATPQPTATGLSGGRVTIQWDTARLADSYEVQQWDGTAKRFRKLPFQEDGKDEAYGVTWTGDLQATVTNLTGNTAYTYRVIAINQSGRTRSADVSATAGAQDPPSDPAPTPNPTPTPPPERMPPTGLSATISGGNVSLTWTGHTNPNYTTQQVKRRVAGDRPIDWTRFPVDLSDTSYTDSTAASGTTYIYRVEALKANGESDMTNAAEIAIP